MEIFIFCRFSSQNWGPTRRHQHRAGKNPDGCLCVLRWRETHWVVPQRQNHWGDCRWTFPHRNHRGPDDPHHHRRERRWCWNLHPSTVQRTGIWLSNCSHQRPFRLKKSKFYLSKNRLDTIWIFVLVNMNYFCTNLDIHFCQTRLLSTVVIKCAILDDFLWRVHNVYSRIERLWEMYELLFMTIILTETNETKCCLTGESFTASEYPVKLRN